VSAFQVKLGTNDLNCVDVPLNRTHSLTPSNCLSYYAFCQELKSCVQPRHSQDVLLATSHHSLLQRSVESAAGSSSSNSGGILENIECRGGSLADDVSFSAVVQRIFTKTVSRTG